ncbi:MAG: Pr2TM family membrane protein [Okeania sp. SIO3I5]|uniref:2TM domain-containing protein n=1 Tax=Okeania sp. SIO3I5 TaxID=2607805 RepID=UPI0013B6C985|nr:2TM domain-containing protein [Okeania sp. SIO3I5]NEQ39032.1 Pr2TM family membrane protein [Okeania sp. SIO3I5]
MTNQENQIIQTYAQDDVQQILQLALANRSEGGELTKAQVLEIAEEMGISPEELAAAEQEWLAQKGESQEKQVFNQVRREKLKQSAIKYGIVNSFLVLLNLVTAHTLSWSLPILLLWGLWLALDAWKTFQVEGEDYENAFQRWRLKKKVGQSIGSLADKVFKNLQ